MRDRGQPRVCPRLASTHTEAGEAFIAYARRIIALNDEAALQLGAAKTTASVRLGLPQDFFDDVMPAPLRRFGQDLDKVHVDVRAGENHSIAEGETLCALPMHWLARRDLLDDVLCDPIPLVLFNHPCLFRQAALAALDHSRTRWRAALTTPSLPAVWSALRSGLGIAVCTDHGRPKDIARVDTELDLPALPAIASTRRTLSTRSSDGVESRWSYELRIAPDITRR